MNPRNRAEPACVGGVSEKALCCGPVRPRCGIGMEIVPGRRAALG